MYCNLWVSIRVESQPDVLYELHLSDPLSTYPLFGVPLLSLSSSSKFSSWLIWSYLQSILPHLRYAIMWLNLHRFSWLYRFLIVQSSLSWWPAQIPNTQFPSFSQQFVSLAVLKVSDFQITSVCILLGRPFYDLCQLGGASGFLISTFPSPFAMTRPENWALQSASLWSSYFHQFVSAILAYHFEVCSGAC